jgi:hypothetical protein
MGEENLIQGLDRIRAQALFLASAQDVVPVTKDDAADLPGGTCRALLVGTAGTCNLIDGGGGDRANVPLQAGYNPIQARRIKLSGTASNIWALY